MTDILDDLSTPALIHAIKANLNTFFRYLGRAATADVHTNQKLFRWHTPLPHPWFNGVLSLQAATEDEAPGIQETLAYFQSRNVAAFTWWLEPGLSEAAWGRQLLSHGLKYDANTPGMAVDLRALNGSVKTPAALEIRRVDDVETLKEWTRTFVVGYHLPAAWEGALFQLMVGLGFDLPMRNYLGYLAGEPVAASSLFLGAGVAGVYNVATVSGARGQGIGAALSLAPLHEALEMGYRAGVLQSSEMGFGVYRRLGFEKLCAMEHFYWKTEAG